MMYNYTLLWIDGRVSFIHNLLISDRTKWNMFTFLFLIKSWLCLHGPCSPLRCNGEFIEPVCQHHCISVSVVMKSINIETRSINCAINVNRQLWHIHWKAAKHNGYLSSTAQVASPYKRLVRHVLAENKSWHIDERYSKQGESYSSWYIWTNAISYSKIVNTVIPLGMTVKRR